MRENKDAAKSEREKVSKSIEKHIFLFSFILEDEQLPLGIVLPFYNENSKLVKDAFASSK